MGEVDPNQRLDNAEEAADHAHRIQDVLVGSESESDWLLRFGEDNLRSWQIQFQWLSESRNFQTWHEHFVEAGVVRNYLTEKHFYQAPTRYIDVPHKDPHQTYYEKPSDPEVEKAILSLLEATGSAENAIQFIELFQSKFPDLFVCGLGYLNNFDSVKAFDGRKPEQMAHHLKVLALLATKQDILPFIEAVDEQTGRQFSFQTAHTYLRYYDRLMDGEDIFAVLKNRDCLERLLNKYHLQDVITQEVKDTIANLDPAILEAFQEIVESSGAAFFYASNEDVWVPWKIKEHGDDINRRLKDFIDILKKKGAAYFKTVEQEVGSQHPSSLFLLPLYRLALSIEKEGGDRTEILRILGRGFGLETPAGSWIIHENFYYNVDPRTHLRTFNVKGPEQIEEVPGVLGRVAVALHQRGLLEKTFQSWGQELEKIDALKQKTLVTQERKRVREFVIHVKGWDLSQYIGDNISRLPFLLLLVGKEFVPTKQGMTLGNADLSTVDLEAKTFWVFRAYTSRLFSMGDEFFGYAWSSVASNLDLSYAKRINRKTAPSIDELDRLEKWANKVADSFPLLEWQATEESSEARHALKVRLLMDLVLYQNETVPSDEELAYFEEECLASPWVQEGTDYSYNSIFVHAGLHKSFFEEYPKASRFLAKIFITQGSFLRFMGDETARSIDILMSHFHEERFQKVLRGLERALSNLGDEKIKFYREVLFGKSGIHLLRELSQRKEDDILDLFENNLLQLTDLLENKEETLFVFIQEAGHLFPKYGFENVENFKAVFDYYTNNGLEKLEAVLKDLAAAGIQIEDLGHSGRFLYLNKEELEGLKRVSQRMGQSQNLTQQSALKVLSMTEAEIKQWETFLQSLRRTGIDLPPEGVLFIYDKPNILPMIELLTKLGFLPRLQKLTSKEEKWMLLGALPYWGEEIYPVLAKHFEETQETLQNLKDRFRYQFDEFNSSRFPTKSIFGLVNKLAALVRFKTELQEDFFNPSRRYSTYDILVLGQQKLTAHPFLQDDQPFEISDYSLYVYALQAQTYPSVMDGRSKDDLVEDILVQLEGRPILERKNNKDSTGNESASRAQLRELPLAKLLKMQWLLNNLEDPNFRQAIHRSLQEDLADTATEHGGQLVAQGGVRRINSLYHPLQFVPVPSAKAEGNRANIEILEKQILQAEGDQKTVLQETLKAYQRKIDSEYVPPQSLRDTLCFGAQVSVHNHSVASGHLNMADHAAPSGSLETGGDIMASLDLGDGIVLTYLGPGKFDINFYGTYPKFDSHGSVVWEEFDFDLGVFDDQQ